MMYQKSLPEALLSTILQRVSEQIRQKQQNYFVRFPNPSMHVRICELPDESCILTTTKAFGAGALIYQDTPVAGCVNVDSEVRQPSADLYPYSHLVLIRSPIFVRFV